MKIAYLSSSTIPSRDANSIHVMKMSQAFAALGHGVILLAPKNTSKEESGVDDIYSYYAVNKSFKVKKIFKSNLKLDKGIIYALGALIKLFLFKPDLVYGRNLPACYLASFFFKTAVEVHAPMKGALTRRLLNSLVKKKNFLGITVISKSLKELVLEQLDYKDVNIIIAHDGADEVERPNETVELLGKASKLNVGYIGHLYRGRGIDIILNCAQALTELNFHIVGGTEEDISFWKKELEEMKLDNVYFYGFVKPALAVKYRNSFDVLIAPYAGKVAVSGGIGDTSKYMSPLKIFEYMSHCKPIVTSDLPVLREVLSEKNAILCDPDNTRDWINAIETLKSKDIREKISNQAFLDFQQNYTWFNRAKIILRKLSFK